MKDYILVLITAGSTEEGEKINYQFFFESIESAKDKYKLQAI